MSSPSSLPHSPHSPSHQQEQVLVDRLILYGETAESYYLDQEELNPPLTRQPHQVPRIMVDTLIIYHDKSLYKAIMERWVAEKNGFTYTAIHNNISHTIPATPH